MTVLLAAAMFTSALMAQIEPSDETVAAAAEAGVPIDLLQGALNSQPGVEVREYLVFDGKLAPPVPVYSVWDAVAACESGGNWATNTGNGFYGGVQFDLPSWRAAGGVGRPDQASRATQIAVAERWLALTGWRSWPACSRRLGLR